MELTFTREDIPKITRAGGSGREAEPWEQHLAPLKDTPNESFRVWTYEKRTSAVSRMSSVRERLVKAVPAENWQLSVRPLPGTEGTTHPEGSTDAEGNDISGTSAEQFGVYVVYAGEFTDEQVAENQRKHDERSARVKAARAKAEAEAAAAAANGTEPATDTPATEPSAKERVAAARAKAGASK